jgi:hypothetical protein
MTKKHTRHKYSKFIEWINPPFKEEHSDLYYGTFKVRAACECGKIDFREASQEEVESYLNERKCARCGHFGEDKHASEQDCFKALRDRVKELEGTVERITDAFSSFQRNIRSSSDYDY